MRAKTTKEPRACTKCGEIYPRTSEFFYADKRASDGLRSCCYKCSIAAGNEWAKANPIKKREIVRKSHEKHREKRKSRHREWMKTHPEANRAAAHRRRVTKMAATGSYAPDAIRKLYDVQKGRCWWNTKHKLDTGYHIDHRIALSKGGTNDLSNIVLACPKCNLSKYNKMPDEFCGRLL